MVTSTHRTHTGSSSVGPNSASQHRCDSHPPMDATRSASGNTWRGGPAEILPTGRFHTCCGFMSEQVGQITHLHPPDFWTRRPLQSSFLLIFSFMSNRMLLKITLEIHFSVRRNTAVEPTLQMQVKNEPSKLVQAFKIQSKVLQRSEILID